MIVYQSIYLCIYIIYIIYISYNVSRNSCFLYAYYVLEADDFHILYPYNYLIRQVFYKSYFNKWKNGSLPIILLESNLSGIWSKTHVLSTMPYSIKILMAIFVNILCNSTFNSIFVQYLPWAKSCNFRNVKSD